MSSSIRLTNSGAPETPPIGYARIFVQDYEGKLHLKMVRPDGTIEVFGTLNMPLAVNMGGTGLDQTPNIGQFLIGTGEGYRLGDIIAGSGINIIKTESSFQINATISNLNVSMPDEFNVAQTEQNGQTNILVTKETQLQNKIYAAPAENNGIPLFRFLQVNDIPDIPVTKIINLIDTIRTESLLEPVSSDSIEHVYDNVNKSLTSNIKDTGVAPGTYGTSTTIPSFTVKSDGRLEFASNTNILIPSQQISDFEESVQDKVGSLIVDSTSIRSEYNDYSNTLKLHINEDVLITTNISNTENTRAPTSQAIKTYVDELVDAERVSRINEDLAINNRLNSFFQNTPDVIDTIVEIADRFSNIDQSIGTNNTQLTEINNQLTSLRNSLNTEISVRSAEINRVYNSIIPQREVIQLTPELMTSFIPLANVQQLSNIMPNSIVAFIDRLGIFEDLDFNLTTYNGKVVLIFTPNILNIIDGTELLRISYLLKF